MSDTIERTLGFSVLRATEAAALVAGRWVGRGDPLAADQAAAEAIYQVLNQVDIDGLIVIGEERRHVDHIFLTTGTSIGNRQGPAMDVVVDSVEGVRLLAEGLPDAVSLVALAPRGTMRSLAPSEYMSKLVVSQEAAHAIGPEALDAPPAWTLGVVARAMGKAVPDLTVFVLKRPRHQTLIEEIRMAGARVLLRPEGDVVGALLAALPGPGADVLMGIGGTAEGVVAACAVKAVGGVVFGRLAPQSEEERQQVADAGLDLKQILPGSELVASDNVFFAATGVTDGLLLKGVHYHATSATTHSLLLRGTSGIRRQIYADHPIGQAATSQVG
jgi:fructose-1,6-bisphosphatase II